MQVEEDSSMSVFQAQRRPENCPKPHQMRRQGLIPMALISRDHGTTLLQAKAADVHHALRHLDGHGGIELAIDEDKTKLKVIVKQVDNFPLKGGVINLTLQEVSAKDVMKLDVSVTPINHGEDEQGTVLTQPTTHIKIQGKMSDMPSHIEVDVSGLEVGHHINAGDVELPNGIKLVSSPDATLFSLQVLKAVSLEPDLPAEPIEGEAADAAATAEGTSDSSE
jgi:large subunit ribosomal protein L25